MTYNTSGKYEKLEKLIAEVQADDIDLVLIHHPEVLGDDYGELVMNLNKLADAGLMVKILPTKDRGVEVTAN